MGLNGEFSILEPKRRLLPTSNAYPKGIHRGDLLGLTDVDVDLIPIYIQWDVEIFGVIGRNPVTYLNRFYPRDINLSHTEGVVAPDHTKSINSPIATVLVKDTGDDVANYLKLLEPAITVPDSEAVIVPDQTITESPVIHTHYDLQTVLTGAFRSPGGVDVDETAAAQNTTANDMTLPPQTPAALDEYKFGDTKQFDVLRLVLGTQGVGVWTVTWEYWNGAWVALAGVVDGTNGFKAAAGTYDVSFTRPGDWAVQNLGGLGNKYYIRAIISAYTSQVTAPLGTQAFIRITT